MKTKKNLWSNEDFRLTPEAVAGSVQVFQLESGGTIYGAILSGEHVSCILGKTKRNIWTVGRGSHTCGF